MPGACLNPYGCEWSIGYLWRWMNWIGRADVFVLALLLAYVVTVVTRVSCRFHLARPARGLETASQNRRKLAADLSVEVGSLKSIASAAPYFGLAGTCVGIVSAFRGFDGERHAVLVWMASGIAAAFVTTAAGILIAVPANCFYNYLRTRIDLLESELSNEALAQRSRSCQARRFPLTKRFSELPAFAVIAAPCLAILVAGYMSFSSFHTPTGLSVQVLKPGKYVTSNGWSVDPIVIGVVQTSANGQSAVYVNSKKTPWEKLDTIVRSELNARSQSIAYVEAENNVPWQTVANVIDVVEAAPADVVLLTVAPEVNPTRMHRFGKAMR